MADTGFILTGTGADGGGGTSWSNPTNIQAEANNASSTGFAGGAPVQTSYLRATNFDFSGSLSSGDTIDGIEVQVSCASANTFFNYEWSNAQLRTSSGRTGADKSPSNPETMPTSQTTVTMGGASDTWSTSYDADDILGSDFGIDIQFHSDPGPPFPYGFLVWWVKIKIHYTASASGYANDVFGVASANIGKVFSVETANIDKVFGS